MIFQNQFEENTSEELFNKYRKTKDNNIKQVLVLRYVYIIKNVAIQMKGVYLDFAQIDDIINEGVMVLMTAIDKFDVTKNVKFETYISKRIRGMIIDIARKNDWVPRSVRKNAKEIDNATNLLYTQLGRMPSDNEIAEYLHISIEKYQEELRKTNLFNLLSLEMLLDESSASKKPNPILNTNTDTMPEQYLQNNELESVLRKGLETLRENEKLVISLYYKNELRMKEIASVLDVSEPRVSQIHANAIRKLRMFMKNFNEDDF